MGSFSRRASIKRLRRDYGFWREPPASAGGRWTQGFRVCTCKPWVL